MYYTAATNIDLWPLVTATSPLKFSFASTEASTPTSLSEGTLAPPSSGTILATTKLILLKRNEDLV